MHFRGYNSANGKAVTPGHSGRDTSPGCTTYPGRAWSPSCSRKALMAVAMAWSVLHFIENHRRRVHLEKGPRVGSGGQANIRWF